MSENNGQVATSETVISAVEPSHTEQLRALMAHYAAERDKHFAEADRLVKASDAHKTAAHQFAGAYDAMLQTLAILETDSAVPAG